jgi:hypothetical protein
MPPLFSGQISDAISELLINLPTRETTLVVKPISHCRERPYKRGTIAINFSVHCTLVPSQPGGDRGRSHMVLNLWLHHIKGLKHTYMCLSSINRLKRN